MRFLELLVGMPDPHQAPLQWAPPVPMSPPPPTDWTPIIVAIIGLVGTVTAAYLTVRASRARAAREKE